MNDGIHMQVSAFVDGELSDNEAQLLLRRLSQDTELRQQVAEYLALGRALRNERSLPGATSLRSRIATAIEDGEFVETADIIEPRSRRYVRPLVGSAIAATVAIAALVGLQQVSVVPEETVADEQPVTVPYYLQRHNQATSESGNNNFNARLVSAQAVDAAETEEGYVEIDAPEDEADDENPENPVEPTPTTP